MATCGKEWGLAELASWQRAQITAVSGLGGFTEAGSSACLACGPWQTSQCSPACLPNFF